MKLVGRKRKVLTAAATAAAAAGLVVGLAGPAAARPIPPAPPGADWVLQGSECLEREPIGHPGLEYTAGGSCVVRHQTVGGRWIDEPLRTEPVYGTRYNIYRLFYRPVPRDRAPVGHLDACDRTLVHGWAKDPDWAGSLEIHLYNQNGLVKAFPAAEASEPGTGGTNQRFIAPHDQAPGSVITVYAIGRDAAGGANGANPPLTRSDGGGTSCVVP